MASGDAELQADNGDAAGRDGRRRRTGRCEGAPGGDAEPDEREAAPGNDAEPAAMEVPRLQDGVAWNVAAVEAGAGAQDGVDACARYLIMLSQMTQLQISHKRI
ncbi:hypothetical protein PIB30_050094 [Stylosanthes scabra]|uniref:Uncharacterized protein n=1 Tax=Stylosanthes scabra TaxID=79078 RepID=A0ABU6YI08_9FABA|nr:hypothetical protein [Stylosanthes scabra]